MSDQSDREQRIAALINRGRCNGALTETEIARGGHLCWSNAVSLLRDVRLLVANSRLARALSLTVLALEELAKPPLLWALTPSDDSKHWATFWKQQFSRHPSKQRVIGAYGNLLKAVGHDIYGFKMSPETVDALDTLKQWGFYVDCVDMSFQSPDQFASDLAEIVDFLFAVAEERADSFGRFHVSVEQSLRAYKHRLAATRLGEFWPPPVHSETELHALLLSLASQYSLSSPPNYVAFVDACEQLTEVAGDAMFEGALSVTGRICCRRAEFHALPTAAARGLFMMKLCLFAVPEKRRRTVIDEWKQDKNKGDRFIF